MPRQNRQMKCINVIINSNPFGAKYIYAMFVKFLICKWTETDSKKRILWYETKTNSNKSDEDYLKNKIFTHFHTLNNT